MSLSSRLNAVIKEEAAQETMEDLSKISYDELQNRTIKFGKSKHGMPYHQVIHEDPGYVTWFVGSYENSSKKEHVEFLTFVKQYVKRMEENQKGREKTTPTAKSKAIPKTKSAPQAQPSTSQVLEESEDEDLEWDTITNHLQMNQAAQMTEMGQRMNQMEQVLQQVVSTLQQLQLKPTPQ